MSMSFNECSSNVESFARSFQVFCPNVRNDAIRGKKLYTMNFERAAKIRVMSYQMAHMHRSSVGRVRHVFATLHLIGVTFSIRFEN